MADQEGLTNKSNPFWGTKILACPHTSASFHSNRTTKTKYPNIITKTQRKGQQNETISFSRPNLSPSSALLTGRSACCRSRCGSCPWWRCGAEGWSCSSSSRRSPPPRWANPASRSASAWTASVACPPSLTPCRPPCPEGYSALSRPHQHFKGILGSKLGRPDPSWHLKKFYVLWLAQA